MSQIMRCDFCHAISDIQLTNWREITKVGEYQTYNTSESFGPHHICDECWQNALIALLSRKKVRG